MMPGGVRESERSTCVHCTDCDREWRGYTELACWELAGEHVRTAGHAVFMHYRIFLAPFPAPEAAEREKGS